MVRERTATPKPKPTLELSTITAPNDVVKIDDEEYDLLNLGSLGLRERQELVRLSERIEAIEKRKALTLGDQADHRRLLLGLAGKVLPDAPREKLEKLPDAQLEDLAVTFFVRGAMRSPRMEMIRKNRIGAISSPGSRTATTSAPESG